MQLVNFLSALLLAATCASAIPSPTEQSLEQRAQCKKPNCVKQCPDGTPYNCCVDYIRDPCADHQLPPTPTPKPNCTAYCLDGTVYDSCVVNIQDPCKGHGKDAICTGPDDIECTCHCPKVPITYLCNAEYFRDPCSPLPTYAVAA